MVWKDGVYNIQTNMAPIVAPHTGINSVVSSVPGSIPNKFYNSPGHLGEYQLTISLATTPADKIMLYVDFGLSHVHGTFVYCEYLAAAVWTQVMCLSHVADVQSEVYM